MKSVRKGNRFENSMKKETKNIGKGKTNTGKVKNSPKEEVISIEGSINDRKICEWTLENDNSCDNKIEENRLKR